MGDDLICGMFSSIVCEVSKPGYSKIFCLNKKIVKRLITYTQYVHVWEQGRPTHESKRRDTIRFPGL